MIRVSGDVEHVTGSWTAPPPHLRAAWVSDIGKLRSRNEDRVLAGPDVVVIADGVGSEPGGAEIADFVVNHFVKAVAGAGDADDVLDAVQAVQRQARQAINGGSLPSGAATLTAVVRLGSDLLVVNVGDSPAWLIEEGGSRLLTTAHRRWDPFLQGYVLLSSLGVSHAKPIAVQRIPIATPLRMVLASDGILDPARPDETPPVLELAAGGTPEAAAERLACQVLAGDTTDNVTIAVVDAGQGADT